jgi:hypothetical protein
VISEGVATKISNTVTMNSITTPWIHTIMGDMPCCIGCWCSMYKTALKYQKKSYATVKVIPKLSGTIERKITTATHIEWQLSQSQILQRGRKTWSSSTASSAWSKLQCTRESLFSFVKVASCVTGRGPRICSLSFTLRYSRLLSWPTVGGSVPVREFRWRSNWRSSVDGITEDNRYCKV